MAGAVKCIAADWLIAVYCGAYMDQVDAKLESFLGAVDAAAGVVGKRRPVEFERSIKSLAKEFAQTAMQSVDDRKQRQASRADVYNNMVPLLREIGERHSCHRRRSLYTMMGLGLVAVGGFIGAVIF